MFKKLAAILAGLAIGGAGAAAAIAAAGDTTGTNVACATATLPAHTIADNGTGVYTIAGTSTTACHTETYTIPTVTVGTTQTTTTSTTTTTPPPPPPTGSGQSVVFWLGWDGGTLSSLPAASVTQVDLFALQSTIAGEAGVVKWPSGCTLGECLDEQQLTITPASFVSGVHALGKKALITIGGSSNPDWNQACSSANVATFAQNVADYMHGNGFDGVDLDLEQDPGTGSLTTVELHDCTTDLATDVHADGGILTSDVDPTTDFDIGLEQVNDGVDQFNAMSYEATAAATETDISNLESQSKIPAAKITVGIDTNDDPGIQSSCGTIGSYSKTAGLMGVMLWFGQQDEGQSPAYPCLNAIAPYVG